MAGALLQHNKASVTWFERFREVYGSNKKIVKAIKVNQE